MTTDKLVIAYDRALDRSRRGKVKPPESHETIDALYAELRRRSDSGDVVAQARVFRTTGVNLRYGV
jgi:hypothetical protein